MLDFTEYMSCTSGDESDSISDFRSRSYTPTKMFKRRITSKLPPSQLMTKLAEKQKKAEEKRMQILRDKEESFRKTREKEKNLKLKLDSQAAQKLAKFNEKLERAEMRKAQHLDSIKDKAKQEAEKLDENAFVLSLTLQGKKVDLEDKIQINSERRQKFLEEFLNKNVVTRERRHEAFKQKREILREQSKDRYLAKTAKIESARMRKNEEVEKVRKSAQNTIKKAMASKKRKQMIEAKINKVVSMIANLNEDEWEKWQQVSNEKSSKFERQKEKLKNQAKVLDKIIKSTIEGKVEITLSETEDLFDDSYSSNDEEMMYGSQINGNLKAHSDSELDWETIPFYFKHENKNGLSSNDQHVYRSEYSELKKPETTIPAKSFSESPKNIVDSEENKESISKDGLNKDMLMKLDQQNMNQSKHLRTRY